MVVFVENIIILNITNFSIGAYLLIAKLVYGDKSLDSIVLSSFTHICKGCIILIKLINESLEPLEP